MFRFEGTRNIFALLLQFHYSCDPRQVDEVKLEQTNLERGVFKIRLATSTEEVRVAQKLRYLVFHQEMGAKLSTENRLTQTEADEFDGICDHLLVICNSDDLRAELSVEDGSVIGTYRLLRQSVATQHQGFYSQAEFDILPLLEQNPTLQFFELGRSCILKEYRGSTVVELLWQGIWNYVRQNQIDVMIGCASFEGVDVKAHRSALQFILQNNKTPDKWTVHAHSNRRLEFGSNEALPIDQKTIATNLPPLIKGYMRLGCYFGRDAVIDDVFNTIDVLVILPISQINPRYFSRISVLWYFS